MYIASVWLEEYQGDIGVLKKAVPASLKFILLAIVTGILVLLGILNLRDRFRWSYITDGVFWKESSDSLKADHIEANGPGNRAGIAPGDRLISVNGYQIDNLGQYADIIGEMKPGTVASYKLERTSGEKGVWQPVER